MVAALFVIGLGPKSNRHENPGKNLHFYTRLKLGNKEKGLIGYS